MTNQNQPKLFGLENSNRDFSRKKEWGKNKFNTSFPAALCCYLNSKGYEANYLAIRNKEFQHREIPISDIFGINPTDSEIYFAFESVYMPFQRYVIGSLPRIDLVIQNRISGNCITGLEIKLTAIPDNTTCDLEDNFYGSEIVVRPDSIVYLACSIARGLSDRLNNLIPNNFQINDWSNSQSVLRELTTILNTLELISLELENDQCPFLIQPIWKTIGKSPNLADNCLDVFVWSNAGFTNFITKIANNNPNANKVSRQTRTAIWLFKMLLDIKENENKRFDHKWIIDNLSYNTKNDKAFASAGNVTNRFLACERKLHPIIQKTEIKNIILGGGQNLLSPERRFDALIFNSPELFE